MKKIVILSNHHAYTYNFRKEIIQRLIEEKYKVYIILPYGEKVDKLIEMGCEFINSPLDRRGMNFFSDLKLLEVYYKVIKKVKPDIVLSYTIKPNIYGGIVCRFMGVPYIANVTGLGTAIENRSILQKVLVLLYRIAFKKADCILFQNSENQKFFAKRGIVAGRCRVIPGSGVNLNEHPFEEYPNNDRVTRFLFIGRIMKDKGIEELIEAASRIKSVYTNSTIQFDAIGFCEADYKEKALELEKRDVIKFHGEKDNVHDYIRNCNAVILPSYHEGMANVLLEAASTGRPVLASNIPGCKETFDENISGFGFEVQNTESLVNTIIKFIELPYERKREMGIAGRKKMELEFDRNIIVTIYFEEINRIMKRGN